MHIGFDIGGTKLAAIGLDDDGQERARYRRPVPRSFDGVVDAIADMLAELAGAGVRAPGVGVSLPRHHHPGRRDQYDRQPALA